MCAYWVDHKNEFNALDYHDDDEPGAGRELMELLKINDIKNRAVFVARRYGGIKIGSERFQCYLNAAISSIQKCPVNSILNIQQNITHPDPRKYRVEFRQEQTRINREKKRVDFAEGTTQQNTSAGHHSYYRRGYGMRGYRGTQVRRGSQQLRGAVQSTQRYSTYQKQGQLYPPPANQDIPTFQFSRPWSANTDLKNYDVD